MNYLAHAMPFLDRPYFAAGTCVPDWLSVVDRRVRMRSKYVEPFVNDGDIIAADVAAGILDHLKKDAAFHNTRAFAELNWQLAVMVCDAIKDDQGLRPNFLGHLLVEVLLDVTLAVENQGLLEKYYDVMDRIEPVAIEAAVNRFSARPCVGLQLMIEEFRRLRILYDYLDDQRLFVRLNQVMRRVKLDQLPEEFVTILPKARNMVAVRAKELLLS